MTRASKDFNLATVEKLIADADNLKQNIALAKLRTNDDAWFYDVIAAAKNVLGVDTKEFAKRLDVSERTMYRWEGRTHAPQSQKIYQYHLAIEKLVQSQKRKYKTIERKLKA